jgi:heat shock protein HtpX
MWEAIRANARRSRLLILLMGAILLGLGVLIGQAVGGRGAVLPSAAAALGVWGLLQVVAFTAGDQLILTGAGARAIRKEEAPRLFNVVEEMTIAAGLPKVPAIYIVDDERPNAFAAGMKPDRSSIAVTSGLLKRLNRDELQGVIAHEIGHIRNHDIRFLTLAIVLVGSISLLGDAFLRTLWYGGGRRRSTGRGGGQAQAVIMILAVVAAILAPIAARLLYLACSRRREYLADATAARLSRFPEGLASALEKISGRLALSKAEVPRALAPLYIVNPLEAGASGAGLLSTHPPVEERIRILRGMAGGAGWADYERAFHKVSGKGVPCLDPALVRGEAPLAARPAASEPAPPGETEERVREVVDLIDNLAGFIGIPCPCGVVIKTPPGFRDTRVRCTRCAREHPVPAAETGPAAGAAAAAETPLVYRRRGQGWEAFRCACGRTLSISPAHAVSVITCRACKRRVRIET